MIPIAATYDDAIRALVGRDLSPAEQATLANMKAHNWTVRVAAEALIGRQLTDCEMQAAKLTYPGAFKVKR